MRIKENKCIEDIEKSRVTVPNTLEILSTNSREPREIVLVTQIDFDYRRIG